PIFGASVGANLALVAGANGEQIKAVGLLSPGLDFLGVKTEPAASEYAGPLLLVSSSEDTQSGDTINRLAALHPGDEKLIALNGAGHGTEPLRNQPDMMTPSVDWLTTTLERHA